MCHVALLRRMTTGSRPESLPKEGINIHGIPGHMESVGKVGEAAAAARDRKQASGLFAALLQLSGWFAMLGGILVLRRRS